MTELQSLNLFRYNIFGDFHAKCFKIVVCLTERHWPELILQSQNGQKAGIWRNKFCPLVISFAPDSRNGSHAEVWNR